MFKKKMIGSKFLGLTVIGFSHVGNFRQPYYLCECDCGKKKIIAGHILRRNTQKSCGCMTKYLQRNAKITHNMSHTRIYNIWDGMKKRCENKKNKSYSRYGGRGITVCDEWHDSKTFFDWAFQHGYRENLTIDRINNDGNYEPSNCRWSTYKEQCANRPKGNLGKNSWDGSRTRNVLGQFN